LQLEIQPFTKYYDGTTYVDISNIQLIGMLDNNPIYLGGTAVFSNPYVGTNTISITGAYLTGPYSSNYTVKPNVTISATITKRILTISVKNKIYNKTSQIDISDVTLNGIQNNDAISIATINGIYANNGNAGTNIYITISTVSLSGDLSSQYDISGTQTLYGNISKKPLTLSVTAINKLYDGTTTADANVVITGGIVNGDTVYIVSFNANFDTPDIGNNKTVTITNIQLGGASSNNYAVSPATTTTASILYNPYIKTCNPVSSSSSSTCNLQNSSNLQSYQTYPNTSRRMKYAIYTSRISYNS
jgi:hypothetical protein